MNKSEITVPATTADKYFLKEWFFNDGEYVQEDQIICQIDTRHQSMDKFFGTNENQYHAELHYLAEASGKLEILKDHGEVVLHEVIGYIHGS